MPAGGDAETGLGVDLGGGLAFEAPKQGVALDLKARGLVAHDAPRYLDTRQAAGYPGTGAGTLNRMRVSGEGPRYSKLGRRVVTTWPTWTGGWRSASGASRASPGAKNDGERADRVERGCHAANGNERLAGGCFTAGALQGGRAVGGESQGRYTMRNGEVTEGLERYEFRKNPVNQ